MFPPPTFRSCALDEARTAARPDLDNFTPLCCATAMRVGLTDDLKHRHAQSFFEYVESTSWLRVGAISALAFAPSFAFGILIELLPLRPPTKGWEANWLYWVRLFLSSLVLSFGVAIQTSVLVPAAGLKARHAVFIAVGTSVGFILQNILIARLWRFPVPFLILLGNPGWQACRYVCLRFAVGGKRWRENPEIKKQVHIARKIAMIQSTLILIYPAYNAIFLRLHGLPQNVFILVLPLIKTCTKRLFARVLHGIPAATTYGAVAVELFDALYLFKCMQTAGSALSGAVLITVDLIENIYHLYDLHKRVHEVRKNLNQVGLDPDCDSIIRESMSRLKSRSIPLPRPYSPTMQMFPRNTITVAPTSFPVQSDRSKNEMLSTEKMLLDRSIQELFSECRHIVVTEFIECAVPMFYALYMFILFHLPNAKYYPEMKHMDAVKLSVTVRNIAIYATLEFISLLYMHFMLLRKFNISALHLLANVLERDSAVFQSIFMGWVIIVLQFTLEHGGTSCTLCGITDLR